ncbi:hypothetical protein HAZT_HAZT001723 [Hyalella azteca]|uniref:Protein kinase domain-containing protein n=1 Tax=Hyalella azteca TaxID=294128 RepID=A0A6A0H6Q4_HYAAZ|nr:hypothetical protein HAZT_HAZT001723 [Hyalella azteca]
MAHNIHGVSEPSKPSQPITLQGGPDKELQRNGARGDAPQQDDEEGDDGIADFEHCVVEVESGEAFSELYSLHEEVGKGRFGIVYRCTDKRTNKQRAAKIIKCIQAKEKEKVREEISIMNALRHPKLLQLAAAFERQRDVVMVMEFIAGGELFERVVADDFTLTERDVVLFMRQICEGVQYMHNCNILHLDLKVDVSSSQPENILCVRKTSHKIKLIDFGLARRFDPAQPCRVLFGTPEFIAPEIINYEPISFASDMWSVGVICYVLLSGLSPFMGDNDAETFANITRAEFDFDDDAFNPISDLAKAFITSLLVNRKEKRLTSQECLQHPWLTKTEGAMYDRVIPTEKLKKFIIRRKWQVRTLEDQWFSKINGSQRQVVLKDQWFSKISGFQRSMVLIREQFIWVYIVNIFLAYTFYIEKICTVKHELIWQRFATVTKPPSRGASGPPFQTITVQTKFKLYKELMWYILAQSLLHSITFQEKTRALSVSNMMVLNIAQTKLPTSVPLLSNHHHSSQHDIINQLVLHNNKTFHNTQLQPGLLIPSEPQILPLESRTTYPPP